MSCIEHLAKTAPQNRWIRPILIAAALAFGLLSGCASTMAPHNGHSPQAVSPDKGYRVGTPRPDWAPTSLIFDLSFSGGGTRAAALAYGVLEELARTPVIVKGQPRRMLDLLETISSVSGGS